MTTLLGSLLSQHPLVLVGEAIAVAVIAVNLYWLVADALRSIRARRRRRSRQRELPPVPTLTDEQAEAALRHPIDEGYEEQGPGMFAAK